MKSLHTGSSGSDAFLSCRAANDSRAFSFKAASVPCCSRSGTLCRCLRSCFVYSVSVSCKEKKTAHILRLAWWAEHAVPRVLYFTQPTAHPLQSADLLTCLSLWWPLLSGGSYFMKMLFFPSALSLEIIIREMTWGGAWEIDNKATFDLK